jgi:hypothetical protein
MSQVEARDPPQFRIHNIDQTIQHGRITIMPGGKHSCYVVLTLVRHGAILPKKEIFR